ncbi:MAG TPA: peptidase inhibitor family I36 protein [Terriglobales bacterium]|nr:peptidase inhibitor family I36 protein [Terriglobales bacterium]
MKSLKWATLLFAISFLFGFITASAQTSIPTNGACFYRDINYRGAYFCTQAGETLSALPSGFNDAIRSIRIFGNVQLTAFNDGNLVGASTLIQNDVADLRTIPLANEPNKNWTTRISSLRVDATSPANTGNRPWDFIWGRRQTTTTTGACFFDRPNFQGRSFCVDQGRALDNLPPGFNDRIQSIQVIGGSEVQMFNDSDFAGAAARTTRDVADLRSWSIPDDPSKNWSGRISSLRVETPRRGRWSNIGGYDRNEQYQALVHCGSAPGNARQMCESTSYIRDAHMINAYGNCRKNTTWGIDNGRLWVSGGCTADFEVAR